VPVLSFETSLLALDAIANHHKNARRDVSGGCAHQRLSAIQSLATSQKVCIYVLSLVNGQGSDCVCGRPLNP
jgi:hypothetical protein